MQIGDRFDRCSVFGIYNNISYIDRVIEVRKKRQRIAAALLGICSMIFLTVSCGEAERTSSKDNQAAASATQVEPEDSIVLTFQGQNGRSVFEITEDEYEIEYIGSAVGNFVNAINSVEINNTYGWLYSVNGIMGTIASDKYITDDSDIVRWHYRKF